MLERSPKVAASSDKMFDMMLDDYRASLERGRGFAKEGEWQSIETYDSHRPVLVAIRKTSAISQTPAAVFKDVTGVWRVLYSEGGMTPLTFEPTHWQRLPEPPK